MCYPGGVILSEFLNEVGILAVPIHRVVWIENILYSVKEVT